MVLGRPLFGTRRSRSRFLRSIVLIFFVWTLIDLVRVQHAFTRPSDNARTLPKPFRKVFITSIHWNNERVLRQYWNDAVVQLAEEFGRENVHVSVYESGSWDHSKDVLTELEKKLDQVGVEHTIVLNATTHADEIAQPPAREGWIEDSTGKKQLRRIPYLSDQRNRALEPLKILEEEHGETYDLILFLNDVVFHTDDIYRLVNTNGGEYAAACSLDFSKPPNYYDTFALRDFEGHETIMQTWPYFRSSTSRAALKHNTAIPVTSCWNGIVAMDAAPFYRTRNPLRFRGISDDLAYYHLEGSECCLIHADNPVSQTKGVWLNPTVRVGYNGLAYDAVNPPSGGSWLSSIQIVAGIWENRIRRRITFPWFASWKISQRISSWEAKSDMNKEKGSFCLINEMQVLRDNGWAHL